VIAKRTSGPSHSLYAAKKSSALLQIRDGPGGAVDEPCPPLVPEFGMKHDECNISILQIYHFPGSTGAFFI